MVNMFWAELSNGGATQPRLFFAGLKGNHD